METEGEDIPVTTLYDSILVGIKSRKTLNFNPNLLVAQTEQLLKILREQKEAFALDYIDMKGIPANLCTHHIYIREDCRPVRQPQRRMNPALKNIVKEELRKLLDARFIYPISDSQWVSPFFIFPKNNGKWKICVDSRELNK